MVFQVVMKQVVKIFIIQDEHVLGSCELQEPYMCQECLISPDHCHILLHVNCTHSSESPELRRIIDIYQLKDGQLLRRYYIPDLIAEEIRKFGWHSSHVTCVAIDPRVPHGQIAVLQSLVMDEDRCCITMYDLCSGCQIESRKKFLGHLIDSAQYSPDGSMIAAVCGAYFGCYHPPHWPSSVLLLCSDSFQIIHTIDIRIHHPCSDPAYDHLLPAFSRNGCHLAAIDDYQNPEYVHIHQMPINSFSLKDCCRRVILHYTPKNSLHRLPLPKELLKFMCFFSTPSMDEGDEDGHTCPCFGRDLADL